MRRKRFLFLLFIFLSYIPVLAQVDTAWVRRYKGLGNSEDVSYALGVDNTGNLYVTGWTTGSGTYYDYTTIKYAPNGDTIWIRNYNGPGNSYDGALALAMDVEGNVCVTGSSAGSGTLNDYATIKYAPSGDTLWVRRYNGPGNDNDEARAMAVDTDGNVHVTGWSWGGGTSYDFATIKYSPSGETLWVRRYNGPNNDYDLAWALAVDDLGNVYVTGESRGTGGNLDYVTIKYASNGDTLWLRRFDGLGNSTDQPYALVVDSAGNVYVTGQSWVSGNTYDYGTVKYSPDGDTLWVRYYNGPANGYDIAVALLVDNAGSVYVSGQSEGSGTSWDFTTIKYTANGDTLWVRRYNGPGNNYDWAEALAIDYFGNVYVAGSTWRNGTDYHYAYDRTTIKYSPSGELLWTMNYNGPGDSSDFANALVVDSNFNVYVTGNSKGIGTNYDFCTIKYIQCFEKSGDPTGDGNVNLSDVVFMVNYIFKDGLKPERICRGDDTGNGSVNLADIIYKINYIFKGGAAPIKSETCCL